MLKLKLKLKLQLQLKLVFLVFGLVNNFLVGGFLDRAISR